MSSFEVLSDISDIEVIAIGSSIRDLSRLEKQYGHGHWRKLKGTATIHVSTCHTRLAELHWYEAHGIGRKEIKRKRYMDFKK
ncbi:MAG: hypothetical protein COX16_10185 [Deltaproteobacteria bacterium CG23_combo_of_CG06-09_8_20_14_all_51_20]|nr:MAG: hypothetical protein COX16_10185 [Deltaproteobacteria bacterium CG23_combo_of_CG06-09_8_20_14_all_51_20]PJB33522.1 MAG: hypothetical protein CO107_15445 [Deltaproteobacteria bacterium CG_4_9_14_3_um_filter_51_14]